MARGSSTRYLVPLGRAAFAGIFVWAAPADFSPQTVAWAAQQGVPMPGLLVPLAGLIALAGGLSVVLGYRAKVGAWLLVLFLVPVTIMMHNFWAVKDPMMAEMQQGFFLGEPVAGGRRPAHRALRRWAPEPGCPHPGPTIGGLTIGSHRSPAAPRFRQTFASGARLPGSNCARSGITNVMRPSPQKTVPNPSRSASTPYATGASAEPTNVPV